MCNLYAVQARHLQGDFENSVTSVSRPFARGVLPAATAKFVGDVGAILTTPYRFARLATITKAAMPTGLEFRESRAVGDLDFCFGQG